MNVKKSRRIIAQCTKVLMLSFMSVVVLSNGVLAAPLSASEIKALYNYPNWVADSGNGCSSGSSAIMVGSDNIEKAYNYFLQKGLTANQAAGIVGNLMNESAGVNPAAQQDGSNSPLPKDTVGFGIGQWTYTSRQQPLVDLAKSKGLPVTDLHVQLDYTWQELKTTYSNVLSKLKASTTVGDATSIILNDYEAPAERVQNLIIRTGNANQVLTRYGGGKASSVVPSASTNANGCTTSAGAVNGSIVQTALNFAWDTRGHGPNESDAKPSYQTAMPTYNGSVGQLPFSDCGVFTSTVMIASGADKNYPRRGTTNQIPYLQKNTTLYREIPNVTNTSQLKPGDILINTDHTYIYVGKQPNGYNSVAASLGERVPQPSNFYDGFMVFRLISNGG